MIRLKSFKRLRCSFAVLCSAMLLVAAGCNREFVNENPEPPSPTPAAPVYMSASIAVRAIQSDLASDSPSAEDEIGQLRVLAFNSATGKLAINKYYGNSERDLYTKQPVGTSAVWKGAFQIVPDKYDFYFIANEDSWPTLKSYLAAMTVGVSTAADLYNMTSGRDFATRIAYKQDKTDRTFFPSEISGGAVTTPGHLFLATRTYKNVLVQPTRNGKGASAADPQHFEAEGDEKVELIRTLAKVKITIPNAATAEPDGVGKYKIKQFLPSRIGRIVLKDEVPHQSLFLNPFFNTNVFPTGSAFSSAVKFTKDWYTMSGNDATRDYVLYDRALTSNANETGLSVGVGAEVKVPQGAAFDPNHRYDCDIWFYVPEHLRESVASDPLVPGTVSGATSIRFEKIGSTDSNTFGIWQTDFTEGQQKVYDNGASSQYYVLPNASTYSKFSVVRNNVYHITVRYAGAELRLHYKVMPWVNGGTSGVYAMDAFNVYTSDPSFSQQLTNIILSTTTQRLASGDYIELKTKSGFTFVDGATTSNTITYGTGTDENKFRHYKTIQLKATSAPVAAGTEVFEVWNQGKLLYTVNAVAQ